MTIEKLVLKKKTIKILKFKLKFKNKLKTAKLEFIQAKINLKKNTSKKRNTKKLLQILKISRKLIMVLFCL